MSIEAILRLIGMGEVAVGFGFKSWQLRRLQNGLHQDAVSIAKLILQEEEKTRDAVASNSR